jgi:hypothetical protein
MKKLILSGGVFLALISISSCERSNNSENNTADDDKRVVSRDSVATEYEVTETVVEYDTTKKTKTVKAEVENDHDDKEEGVKVKKDRD